MLDLEVIPERAVSFGQWQFVLGESLWWTWGIRLVHSWMSHWRNAPSTGCRGSQETVLGC